MSDARKYFEQDIMFHMAGAIAERIYNRSAGHADNYSGVRSVCFHESGHAVVLLYFGKAVYGIEIHSRGGMALGYPPTDKARQEPIVLDSTKISKRSELITELCPTPCDLPALEAETERILRENWSKVERLAQALYSRTIGVSTGVRAFLPSGLITVLLMTEAERTERYGMEPLSPTITT